MVPDEPQPERTLPLPWLVALYLAALAVHVYVFWVLPSGSMLERLAFSLQLIGIYNLALTFLGQTDIYNAFALEEMTSPNIRNFLAATFRALAVISSLSSLAVRGFPPPLVTRRLPLLLQVLVVVTLGLTFAILSVVLVVLVVPFFLLGIAPIAYIGYVLTGVLLDAVASAPEDIQLSSDEGSRSVSLKETVRAHQVQLRTLLVGVPATALGVATAGYALLTQLRARQSRMLHQLTWLASPEVHAILAGTREGPPRGQRLPAMLRVSGRGLPRVASAMSALERNHPAEPHMYLPFVGVDPEWRMWRDGAAQPCTDESDFLAIQWRHEHQEVRPPSGHVFRAERGSGPVWYAKYRLPDGRQVAGDRCALRQGDLAEGGPGLVGERDAGDVVTAAHIPSNARAAGLPRVDDATRRMLLAALRGKRIGGLRDTRRELKCRSV